MSPADEPSRHYALLASAICGRNITVHWHSSEKFSAYTDSISIFLPIKKLETDQTFDVIAQALLIRAHSLQRRIIQRLVGKKELSKRYLYAEVCRTTKQYQHLLPRYFCESVAILNFPYSCNSPTQSYQLAASKSKFPTIPPFIGTLRNVLILKTTIPDEAFAALTKKQQKGEFTSSDLPTLDEEDEEDAQESKILKLFQNPLMSGGALSKMLSDILGGGLSGKPEEDPNSGGGSELSIGSTVQAKKKGLFATMVDFTLNIVDTPQHQEIGSTHYPEWDYIKKQYRDNWALVDELDPWCEEPQSDELMTQLLQPAGNDLKRKLAGIGLSFEIHHNMPDGEDFSLDRLIDYIIDYNLGTTPDERLYEKSQRTRRDLATLILLDVSGSTAEKDEYGQPIHHQQIALAYRLLTAVHALGDQVALYAFHSWGRSLVRLLRIKSFKEQQINSRVRDQFKFLEPVGYTRSGAALRHAAHKLTTETGLPYRLLIVITDGFSYDQDYEGKYGEEDTKKALEEIRQQGIGCICLTIGSAQEETKLKEVYGTASVLSVRNYQEFIGNIRPAVLKAIKQIKR